MNFKKFFEDHNSHFAIPLVFAFGVFSASIFWMPYVHISQSVILEKNATERENARLSYLRSVGKIRNDLSDRLDRVEQLLEFQNRQPIYLVGTGK